MNDRRLYESIMNRVDTVIYSQLNEAYDNMLFEEFNFKEFFDKTKEATKKAAGAVRNAAVNAKIDLAYKFLKRYIAGLIEEIKNEKGMQAAQQYVNELKPKLLELMKEVDVEPAQIKFVARLLAVGFIGVTICYNIEQSTKQKIAKEEPELYKAGEFERYINADGSETILSRTNNNSVNNKTVDATDLLGADFSDYKKSSLTSMFDTKVVLPTELREDSIQMYPTDDCIEYIKFKEALSLYPYFSTETERAAHKVTAGYGHVFCSVDKDGRHWFFPGNAISPERQQEIKQTILNYERNGWIEGSECKDIDGVRVNTHHNSHVKPIITKEEAQRLLDEDLKIADKRVKKTLGILPCNSPDYNVFKKINPNVGNYCYYNQNIYDMLVSCIINTGVLPNKSKFSQRLQNCSYDTKNNMIDKDDFVYTFQAFCSLSNSKRRLDEYQHFGLVNTNKILQHFNMIKPK